MTLKAISYAFQCLIIMIALLNSHTGSDQALFIYLGICVCTIMIKEKEGKILRGNKGL